MEIKKKTIEVISYYARWILVYNRQTNRRKYYGWGLVMQVRDFYTTVLKTNDVIKNIYMHKRYFNYIKTEWIN